MISFFILYMLFALHKAIIIANFIYTSTKKVSTEALAFVAEPSYII